MWRQGDVLQVVHDGSYVLYLSELKDSKEQVLVLGIVDDCPSITSIKTIDLELDKSKQHAQAISKHTHENEKGIIRRLDAQAQNMQVRQVSHFDFWDAINRLYHKWS